jgi:tetratricopeptide (TPR) repeat protein
VHLLIVLVFFVAPSLAWAQAPSVTPINHSLSAQCPSTEQWQKASLAELNSFVLACDEVALFHARRGTLLLTMGQIEEAAVALEKALLIDPNLPGAQLDFAQALAQIGQRGSARAMLAQVLERPDIEPALKGQLGQLQKARPSNTQAHETQNQAGYSVWQWSAMAQTALGRETNLNSATYTDSLTLMLSNGPVTIGLSDSAKPIAGNALKSSLVVQGFTKAGYGGIALGELSVLASGSNKYALGKAGQSLGVVENNSTAEALIKYSLPMQAGVASGQWQMALGGTQFWQGSSSAYSDNGAHLKFSWDTLGQTCKLAPSVGASRQLFPLSSSLNGVYSYVRMELGCKEATHETQIALGAGFDKASSSTRLGGDKHRKELLVRHERYLGAALAHAQLSSWFRYAKSEDRQVFSDLLGNLITSSHRTDWGIGYWVPAQKSWSVGLNLEATSQRSNNTLFNLRNLGVYLGLRWRES